MKANVNINLLMINLTLDTAFGISKSDRKMQKYMPLLCSFYSLGAIINEYTLSYRQCAVIPHQQKVENCIKHSGNEKNNNKKQV